MTAAFAELGARTNFTLLEGASHPAEMVAQASMLGHAGIGVCDLNSLAGVVRAHVAAKDVKLRFVVGARIVLDDGAAYLAWPTDRESYGRLTKLLSLGRMRAPKGQCQISRACEIAANSDPLRGVFASKADPSDAVSVSSSRWRLEGISGDDWCGSDWRYPAGVF